MNAIFVSINPRIEISIVTKRMMTIKITAFVIIPILSLLVFNTVSSAQTAAAVITSNMTKAYENSQSS